MRQTRSSTGGKIQKRLTFRYNVISLLLSPVIALFFLSESSLAPNAETTTEAFFDNTGELIGAYAGEDNNFYLLTCDKNIFNIVELDAEGNSAVYEIDIEPDKTAHAFFGGEFRFFQNCAEEKDGGIFRYVKMISFDCLAGIRRERVINNAQVTGRLAAFDGERSYLPSDTSVAVISSSLRIEDEIALSSPCRSAAVSDRGDVFFSCYDGTVRLIGGSALLIPVSSDTLCACDGHIFDGEAFYDFYGNQLCGGFDSSRSAAYFDGCFIGNISGGLTAVKGEGTAFLSSVSDESFICCSDDTLASFTPEGSGIKACFFTAEDVSAAFKNDKEQKSNDRLSDDGYLTIEYGTTAAAFRNMSGTDTEFFKNGSKYSGKLGTGMTAVYDNFEYTVIVIGDLTGEGSVNSRDCDLLVDHLIGAANITGAYLIASDLNRDGKTDLVDAAILYNDIKKNR